MYDIAKSADRTDLLTNWNIIDVDTTEWKLGMYDIRYFWSIFYPRMVGRIWKEGITEEWLWDTKSIDRDVYNLHRYVVYLLDIHGRFLTELIDPFTGAIGTGNIPNLLNNDLRKRTLETIRSLLKYFCRSSFDSSSIKAIPGYNYEFILHDSGMGLPVVEPPQDPLALHYFYANRVVHRPTVNLPLFTNDFVALEYVLIPEVVGIDIGNQLGAETRAILNPAVSIPHETRYLLRIFNSREIGELLTLSRFGSITQNAIENILRQATSAALRSEAEITALLQRFEAESEELARLKALIDILKDNFPRRKRLVIQDQEEAPRDLSEGKGTIYEYVAELSSDWRGDDHSHWLMESSLLYNILDNIPRFLSQWWYEHDMLGIQANLLRPACTFSMLNILLNNPIGIHLAFNKNMSRESRGRIFRRFLSTVLEKPLLGDLYKNLGFAILRGSGTAPFLDTHVTTTLSLSKQGFTIEVGDPPSQSTGIVEISEGRAGNPMFTNTHTTA